jgi:1-acyl-sn-glycerol-3-phosphate acyltransferase
MDRQNRRMIRILAFPFLMFMFLASVVVYATVCIVTGIFSRKLSQSVGGAWGRHLLFILGVRVIVRGGEKLDRGRRYIFFSNHQSALDIPVLYSGLSRPLCFIAKKELFLIPFFGWGLAAMGHVSIDRASPRKAKESLARGVERLKKQSFSLILFPEGTRSRDGTLGEFKQGSFSLALESGAAVVPVALRKVNERLPKKSLMVTPGPVYIDICDPIDPSGMEKSELAKKVREEIGKIVS